MVKELRIAKVGNDDLIIKPILKDFYCRYCCSIAQCASTPHRSGFWMVLVAIWGPKRFVIIDGFGSSEKRTILNNLTDDWKLIYEGMSGAMRFFSAKLGLCNHVTCGGWYEYFPLPRIIELDKELEKRIDELKQKSCFQIESSDLPTIMRLLRANLIRKYQIFKNVNVDEIEFYIEFADLLPLLKAYKRSRTLVLAEDIIITELPNSFTAMAKVANTEFKIPKKKYYTKRDLPECNSLHV